MSKNYTSNIKIKNLFLDQIAPKYFDMENTSDLNVGLFGYINDIIATAAEDAFNTTTAYMNEIFPHLAILPETVYNNASLFKIDGVFATPAKCKMYLFIQEDDILKHAKRVSSTSSVYDFYLDADTTISVENKRFKPDYNIKISYKKYKNDYIFTAMYDMELYGDIYTNSISDIINPYIKVNRINYQNVKFLQLEIITHQVEKFVMEEVVTTGGILNIPTYTITFDDSLANFEIFYKAPGQNIFTQLKKLADGSIPIKAPFCYYNLIDTGKLEITFTPRDGYFQPEYNSSFIIDYYTTTGSAGTFTSYNGTNITVESSSSVYDYNNGLTLFAVPMNGTTGGSDQLSLSELQELTVERFATVNSYTNENDLQLYFNNFNSICNSKIFFIKKRDDIFSRIFSSFSLLKDSSDEFIHTNTLKLLLNADQFDTEYEQSDMYILKPGRIFTYKEHTLDTVVVRDGNINNYSDVDDLFVYSNPFLIYFLKNPGAIGYYNNIIDSSHTVDYTEVNDESLVQFICNSLKITRNAHLGEDRYSIKLAISPTTELDNPMVLIDEETSNVTITDSIKVRVYLTNDNMELAYTELSLISWDIDSNAYIFEGFVKTDDYITLSNKIRVLDMFDASNETQGLTYLVDMTDAVINIHTYYKYLNDDEYTETNVYSTTTDKVNFILPMRMINSTVKYTYNNDGEFDPETNTMVGGTYSVLIDSSPLVRASVLSDINSSNEFYSSLMLQYNKINEITDLLVNNFNIDLKFYNTYGKSRNFFVGDSSEQLLDRVNIKITFKVRPVFGVDNDELTRDLSIFIKDFIESINNSGTNSIYISNLIRELENNFSSISYLKFVSFNDYGSDIQAMENMTIDLSALSNDDRKNYVPEYLTVSLDDISIELI